MIEEKRYWEDLSDEEKKKERQRVRNELERLLTLDYPIKAIFGGDQLVTVLGPISRFPPYDTHPAAPKEEWKGANQLLLQDEDGSRMIGIASSLTDPKTGKRFVTPAPSMKNPSKLSKVFSA